MRNSAITARPTPRWIPALTLALSLLTLASTASAQPFGAWMTLGGKPNTGHARFAADAALNPTDAFTFEAWVAITNVSSAEDCRSIAGKSYLQGWWIGLCGIGGKPTLRSYLKGGGSAKNGGEIEPGRWTHIAVVFNGTQRLHYINGELARPLRRPVPSRRARAKCESAVT